MMSIFKHGLYELDGFQSKAVNECLTLKRSILISPIGSGKTLMLVDIINRTKGDILWVSPLSVCKESIPLELNKFLGDNVKVFNIAEVASNKTSKFLETAHDYKGRKLILTNPERLVKVGTTDIKFSTVLSDESTLLANHSSIRSKLMLKMCGMKSVKYVIIASDNPSADSLQSYFMQAKIIDGGKALGTTITAFRRTYMVQNPYCRFKWDFQPSTGAKIMKRLKSITVTVDRGVGTQYNPTVVKAAITVSLPKQVSKIYKSIMRDSIYEIDDNNAIIADTPVTKLTKLRQIASGGIITDNNTVILHKKKLKALTSIKGFGVEKVIVMIAFKVERQLIESLPVNAYTIDTVDAWRDDKAGVLILNPLSACYGLNLQECSIMVFYSLPLSSLQYTQSQGRIIRRGQKNKCYIYSIICKDTVDEKITNALTLKFSNSTRMLNYLIEGL